MNKGLKDLLKKTLEDKSIGVMMMLYLFLSKTGYLMSYLSIG